MKYDFTIVIEPDDAGFHAFVPSLPGCHSFGDTLDEARNNISEAIELHVECMIEDDRNLLITDPTKVDCGRDFWQPIRLV